MAADVEWRRESCWTDDHDLSPRQRRLGHGHYRPLRADACRTLRSLDLARLQRYPPPKLVGLKFGNETRVLRRFLQGRSSTLDASALSSWYRTFASARDRLLYRAFRQNDAAHT
jgi:hypothetical protein